MVRLLWFVGTLVTFAAFAKEPAAEAFVTVDTSKVLGKIKPMNSVNNGPVVAPVLGDQKIGNFAEYRAAEGRADGGGVGDWARVAKAGARDLAVGFAVLRFAPNLPFELRSSAHVVPSGLAEPRSEGLSCLNFRS